MRTTAKSAPADGRPRAVVDRRIALIELVHALAFEDGGNLRVAFNSGLAYSESARAHFGRSRGHPALKLYRESGLDRISAFKLSLRALSLPGPFFDGNPLFWNPGGDTNRPQMIELLQALVAFARDAKAEAFFESQAPFFRKLESGLDRDIARSDYTGILRRYSGLEIAADYNIWVCPLLRQPTSSVDFKVKRPRVDTFWPPAAVRDGSPDFAYGRRGPVVWHELGHVLLDDLAETHAAAIGAAAPAAPLDPHLYGGDWKRWVLESAAQGLANRVLAWALEQELVQGGTKLMPGTMYLEPVEESLREYEADRKKYPTLREFYPCLIAAIASAARSKKARRRGTV